MPDERNAAIGNGRMMPGEGEGPILSVVSEDERRLVRLAAAVTGGDEATMRAAVADAVHAPHPWVEEVILQSYLFAGFPRALNATREWRRTSGVSAPASDPGEDYASSAESWRAAGEVTCRTVYGEFYEPLRRNIRHLHPALDAWMIVEGYGKVLSRPALDLARRELCIVAACAAARQDRQLHSHLHGALNAGATPGAVADTLAALEGIVPAEDLGRALHLLSRVVGDDVR